MTLNSKFIQSFIFLLILSNSIHSQADISEVSIKLGVIRNYQEAIGEGAYEPFTFFPEIEVGGNFIIERIKWGVSFGVWNNTIDNSVFRDYCPNSYYSVAVASRFYYSLSNSETSSTGFEASLLAGISYQIITTSPLFSTDIFGDPVAENRENIVEPIIGAQFGYKLNNSFRLLTEIDYHFMNRNKYDINQVELKFLISYIFS